MGVGELPCVTRQPAPVCGAQHLPVNKYFWTNPATKESECCFPKSKMLQCGQRGAITYADTSSDLTLLRDELLVKSWLTQILCYGLHVCVLLEFMV